MKLSGKTRGRRVGWWIAMCGLIWGVIPGQTFAQGAKGTPRPVTRALFFPPLELEGGARWEWSKKRYSMIVVLASWNQPSREIVETLKPYLSEFRRRNVGILGVASHDSEEALRVWEREVVPGFPVERGHVNLLAALKNPKVPSFWLVSDEGTVLKTASLPSVKEVTESLSLLLQWTSY